MEKLFSSQKTIVFKKTTLAVLCAPVAMAAALALYLHQTGQQSVFLWHCPLFEIFGIECPTCGATRCLTALLRLDFASAFRYNALMVFYYPLFAAAYLHNIYHVLRFGSFVKVNYDVITAAGILLLIFGAVRNFPFYPYSL